MKARHVGVVFIVSILAQITILKIDGFSWIDSCYGTAAAITTVGFGDISPQSQIARAVYAPFMVISVVSLPTVGVILWEQRYKRIKGMSTCKHKGHVVILSDSPEMIAASISEMPDLDICIVSDIYETCPFGDVHFVKGKITDKSVIQRSNVCEASHVIVGTNSDEKTIVTTALVRELAPDVTISATIVSQDWAGTLKTVGASKIINTDTVTGRLLAGCVTEPCVVSFITDVTTELDGSNINEYEATKTLAGKTFKEAQIWYIERGQILVGIGRGDRHLVKPGSNYIIQATDKVLVLI